MKKLSHISRIIVGVSMLSLLPYPLAGAEANSPTEGEPVSEGSWLMDFAMQDYLFGDWGGRRTQLSERGIDFEMMYFASIPSVIEGGKKNGAVYQGLMAGMADFDTEKLMNWYGGQFHVGLLSMHGVDHFSDSYIGDLNKVSLIDFPNAFKLWETWYEQRFMEDRLSLKMGVMAVDQDFLVPTYSQTLVNQTFYFPTLAFNLWDIPDVAENNHALPATPYGALGARIKYQINDSFYVQAGVYDGNPDTSSSFIKFELDSEEGALAFFETGISYDLPLGSTDLPGTMKLAGYYHTGDFVDVNQGVLNLFGLAPTPVKSYSDNYGILFLLEQQLYKEVWEEDPAEQGLGGFFRLGFAPSDRNLTQFEIDGGLVYKGLFPSRDYDSLAIGASYLKMSDDIHDAQQTVNSVVPGFFSPVDYEGLVEITYKAQLTAWWTLQPSVQWVLHPGGSSENEDAMAFVVLSTVRF